MTTIDLIERQIGQNDCYIRELQEMIRKNESRIRVADKENQQFESAIHRIKQENSELKRNKRILEGDL